MQKTLNYCCKKETDRESPEYSGLYARILMVYSQCSSFLIMEICVSVRGWTFRKRGRWRAYFDALEKKTPNQFIALREFLDSIVATVCLNNYVNWQNKMPKKLQTRKNKKWHSRIWTVFLSRKESPEYSGLYARILMVYGKCSSFLSSSLIWSWVYFVSPGFVVCFVGVWIWILLARIVAIFIHALVVLGS